MRNYGDDPPVWIRERTGEKWQPRAHEPRARYDYFLPEDWARRKAAERALKQGAHLTTAPGVLGRRIDDTVKERVVVMPRDSRRQKDSDALAMVDFTPGHAPTVFIGDQETAWQEMGEQIDEGHHYQLDRTPEREREDLQERWVEQVEIADNRRKGKVVGGSRVRFDKDGKPEYPLPHRPNRWNGSTVTSGDVRRAGIKGE
jgi:hypothetical protein